MTIDIKANMGGTKSLTTLLLEQLLVFPTAVVLLVSATFIFGGKCAVWQWWMAVVVALAWPFWKSNWKSAAYAGALFLAVLFLIWLMSGISITREWWDSHTYHYPAIRMLMLGWNPVYESTCEEICNACGQPDGFNIWPVLSMPRSIWYFSACAAFFTQNHFDYYHPIILFSLCSGIGYVWKSLNGALLPKIVAAIFIVSVSQLYPHALDVTMSLAALGLFACHYAYLKENSWQPVPMVCFSFWMASAKQTGIVFCAVAWTCFAVVLLVRERRIWKNVLLRMMKAGGIAAVLFLVVNISPYVTSSINYKHPLYPQFTVDAEKYPPINFTADFLEVNDDAKAMSNKMAMFLNAFVSSDMVRNFYEWKLDKPGFRPKGLTWKYGGGKDGWDTPLGVESRCWVMIPIVILIMFGGLAERFIAAVMLLCAIAVPTEMIGLLRYVSMNQFAIVFCLPLVWRLVVERRVARFVCAGAMLWIGWDKLCAVAKTELELIDDRLVAYDCFKRGLPKTLYYNQFARRHNVQASLNLMRRLVPGLVDSRFETIPEEMYRGADNTNYRKNLGRLNAEYPRFPDWSFRVPKWYDVAGLSARQKILRAEMKPKGVWAGSLYEFKVFWKCFAADVPRAVWLRLTGRIDNHMQKQRAQSVLTSDEICLDASFALLQRWGFNALYVKHDDGNATIDGVAGLQFAYPNWLKKNGGQGVAAEGSGLTGECSLSCSVEGDVVFFLKGVFVEGQDSKPVPVYADFESFKVDGRELLAEPVQVCHTGVHRIHLHVKKGATLRISIRLKPHRYKMADLRQVLLDACDVTFATQENVDRVIADSAIKQHVLEVSNRD